MATLAGFRNPLRGFARGAVLMLFASCSVYTSDLVESVADPSTGGAAAPAGSGGTALSGSSNPGGGGSAGTVSAASGEGNRAVTQPTNGGGYHDQGGAGAAAGASQADAGASGAAGAGEQEVVLFEDDFESGGNQWHVEVGTGWGVFAGPDGASVYRMHPLFSGSYVSKETQGAWADQVVRARVKVTTFGGAGPADIAAVFARFGDVNNYYQAALRPDGRASIRACVNGASGTIKTSPMLGIVAGSWYDLSFQLIGSSLELYVDGKLVASVTDARLSAGAVALGGNNSAAQFDDVQVALP